MAAKRPRGPNILITGTPGTGKTTLSEHLAQSAGLKYINISTLAIDNELFDGYDATLQCPIIDEDRVLDEMEDDMANGGIVVEYHSCEFFPERFFDAVFVLRTNNTALYERLQTRGYCEEKLQSNIQCEIFQVILDEAKTAYRPDIVVELQSNTPDDMEQNIDQITAYIEAYKGQ